MALIGWLVWVAVVAVGARALGRRAAGWSALAGWGALPLYNAWVLQHCSGDCNIRVDLLVVAPVLLVLSVWWAVSSLRRRRR